MGSGPPFWTPLLGGPKPVSMLADPKNCKSQDPPFLQLGAREVGCTKRIGCPFQLGGGFFRKSMIFALKTPKFWVIFGDPSWEIRTPHPGRAERTPPFWGVYSRYNMVVWTITFWGGSKNPPFGGVRTPFLGGPGRFRRGYWRPHQLGGKNDPLRSLPRGVRTPFLGFGGAIFSPGTDSIIQNWFLDLIRHQNYDFEWFESNFWLKNVISSINWRWRATFSSKIESWTHKIWFLHLRRSKNQNFSDHDQFFRSKTRS